MSYAGYLQTGWDVLGKAKFLVLFLIVLAWFGFMWLLREELDRSQDAEYPCTVIQIHTAVERDAPTIGNVTPFPRRVDLEVLSIDAKIGNKLMTWEPFLKIYASSYVLGPAVCTVSIGAVTDWPRLIYVRQAQHGADSEGR